MTGAGGIVGMALRKQLRDRYDLRLLFYPEADGEVEEDAEVVVANMADFEAMQEACAGVDAIVHLAVSGGQVPWLTQEQSAQRTLTEDLPGVYNLYEGARINGVPTVVFASSNHVTRLYEEEGLLACPDSSPRPDSIYGAGKAFGEALGRFYSDRHGLRVFCLRIANVNPEDEPEADYEPGTSRWLSHRDLAQLVCRCIETEGAKFGNFYGVSGGSEKKWDLSNVRELLGYEPEDDGSLEAYRSRFKKGGG